MTKSHEKISQNAQAASYQLSYQLSIVDSNFCSLSYIIFAKKILCKPLKMTLNLLSDSQVWLIQCDRTKFSYLDKIKPRLVALDNNGFSTEKFQHFCYFLMKIYVVGTHLKHLRDASNDYPQYIFHREIWELVI